MSGHPGAKRERAAPEPLRPPQSAGGRAPGTPAWLPWDYALVPAPVPQPAPKCKPLPPLALRGPWYRAPPTARPRRPAAPAPPSSPAVAARGCPPSDVARASPPASPASAVPVPDGRRSVASEAKRGDNARRACEARLTSPGGGFFAQPVLRAGASEQEHAIATVLVTGAEDRAARANHGSKDKRLGTSLGKYELLMQVLPSLRPFEPLRSEGDLETSERNEILLLTVAEFIRRRPKSAGDLIKGDSVSGQVSGIKAIVEEHLGRLIIAPTGGMQLARALRQMRYEDGPSADRALSLPLRSADLDALALDSTDFDVRSPGWPTARYALLKALHQGLMRGGEPGTLPGEPFRPALGVCWADFQWLNQASGSILTERHPDTGALHWALILLIRGVKDTYGRHKKVPTTIASKHPANDAAARDVTCPYFAILRLWEEREHLVPKAARGSTPFFVGPNGSTAVDTDVVFQVVTDAASALGLDASAFGSSACRRGGATDLRDKFGSDRGKHMIVQRGRWCHTDIDEIYSRASLGEHIAASVALSSSGGTRSLEQVVPGWAQPARFGR